jgi:hypothetical protein
VSLEARACEADVEESTILDKLSRCGLVGAAVPASEREQGKLEPRKDHHVELTALGGVVCRQDYSPPHLHTPSEVKQWDWGRR